MGRKTVCDVFEGSASMFNAGSAANILMSYDLRNLRRQYAAMVRY